MTPSQILKNLLAATGLRLATYSVGDGLTRYRFFPAGRQADYFGGGAIATAYGRKEAITFLRGYLAAKQQTGG